MYTEKVSVVIPSYNPDEKLQTVISGLAERGFSDVIVVDDGSAAEYKKHFEFLSEYPQYTLLTHPENRGKGAALKTALSFFTENRKDRIGVVTADGDAQHSTDDICAVSEALCETPDTFIIGARDFDLPQVPARSKFGNKLTSFIFRTGVGIKITDTQSGLRAIPATAMDVMSAVKGDRYEYETNALLALKKNGIPFREIRINTVYIDENATSHFHVIRDSVRIYANILKYAANSLICAGVDNLLFFVLSLIFKPEPDGWLIFLLVVCARVVSALLNYTLNRRTVFNSEKSGKSLIRYAILAIAQVGLSAAFTKLLAMLFGARAAILQTIIKILVDVILFFISYRIQKIWVFGTENKKDNTIGEETK